jgi:hypothetical protein
MPFNERDLSDYVDVAQRIADFREQWPEGSLRPWNPAEPFRFMQAQGFNKDGSVEQQSFVVVVAAAYRHGLDENPGIGMAWEVFPGRTPYTRGSELQNAETSAWGRAIIAVGASDSKRGIASREEVRNRRAEREDGLPVNKDGSLSRSRTTDEEKAAAGVMTSGQQAAHNALRREGEPPAEAIEKLSTTPVDDPFYAEARPKPAGWLLSEEFARLGVFDRGERLAQTSELIGRPISSSNELEPAEVQAVLNALRSKAVPA